jgi:asparagine synthase (glutamine-hydrolysing)
MKTNLPMLLHFEDRNSMAHSIESRVPFLDYRLVEFIYSLPDHYKITDGITKRILRDSLEGIIPKEIQNRMDKLGFATPEEIWVKKNASLFRQKIEYAIEKSNGILKKDKVLFYFDQIISEKRPFDFWIWRIINFGEWVETFNVKV